MAKTGIVAIISSKRVVRMTKNRKMVKKLLIKIAKRGISQL